VTQPPTYHILGETVTPIVHRYEHEGIIALELRAVSESGKVGERVFTASFEPLTTPALLERMLQGNLVYVRDYDPQGMYEALIAAGILENINDYPLARLTPQFWPQLPEQERQRVGIHNRRPAPSTRWATR
jgi:hypothetical protein